MGSSRICDNGMTRRVVARASAGGVQGRAQAEGREQAKAEDGNRGGARGAAWDMALKITGQRELRQEWRCKMRQERVTTTPHSRAKGRNM